MNSCSVRSSLIYAFAALWTGAAAAVSYNVQGTPPWWASTIDPAPVGVSFEFFTWPQWISETPITPLCIGQMTKVYGQTMPIRIGGTTEDRATYDPNLDLAVNYTVADFWDAPDTLTYGPPFFQLISNYAGETMLGFNRGDDNQTNAYEALRDAQIIASQYLWAIELGNEPDLYLDQNKPVSVSPWDASQEGTNQAEWDNGAINIWGTGSQFLAAGSYAYTRYTPWPNTDYLIETAFDETIQNSIKVYSGHLYSLTGGDLDTEMAHAKTVSDLSEFVEKIANASEVGRPFILGETNFHAYNTIMDATFGAALVTLDRTLRATAIGITRLFYHQSTVNVGDFNWWSTNLVNMPFYGAYMAALALSGGDQLVAIDDGSTSYAGYVVYQGGLPSKIVLINTDYYSGSGDRSSTTFVVGGLNSSTVTAIRMTADNSNSTTPTQPPTIAGQNFDNNDCSIVGTQEIETTQVISGQGTFTLQASEALMIYL